MIISFRPEDGNPEVHNVQEIINKLIPFTTPNEDDSKRVIKGVSTRSFPDSILHKDAAVLITRAALKLMNIDNGLENKNSYLDNAIRTARKAHYLASVIKENIPFVKRSEVFIVREILNRLRGTYYLTIVEDMITQHVPGGRWWDDIYKELDEVYIMRMRQIILEQAVRKISFDELTDGAPIASADLEVKDEAVYYMVKKIIENDAPLRFDVEDPLSYKAFKEVVDVPLIEEA